MVRKNASTMNRSDLIRHLADKNPRIDSKTLERYVDLVFESIAEALAENRRVEIRGFGSFWTKERSERISRNPRSGESVFVAAKRVPAFRPGRQLRGELVRAGGDSVAAQKPTPVRARGGTRGGDAI